METPDGLPYHDLVDHYLSATKQIEYLNRLLPQLARENAQLLMAITEIRLAAGVEHDASHSQLLNLVQRHRHLARTVEGEPL